MTAIVALCVVCFGVTGPEAGRGADLTVHGSPGRLACIRLAARSTAVRSPVTGPASAGPGAYAIPFAAGERDPWFGSDKLRHFLTAFAVTGYAHAGLRALDLDHDAAVAGGIAISLAAGIGKEIHDVRAGSFFSLRDLVWDAAGALAGALLVSAAR